MEELIIVFEAVRDNTLTNVDLFSNKYCLGYKELKKLCITSLEKVIGENNIKLHWSGDYAEFWNTDTDNPDTKDVQWITYIELDAVIQTAKFMEQMKKLFPNSSATN